MVNPPEPQEPQIEDLHIFVNRRKFEEGDGVRSEMTGWQIADLVNVPAENAIIRVDSVPARAEVEVVVETGPGQGEVDVVVETGPGEVDVVVDPSPGQDEVDVVVETGPGQDEVEVVVETGPGRDEVDVVVETGPNPGDEVGLDDVIAIVNGMHFLVTRRIVEGG